MAPNETETSESRFIWAYISLVAMETWWEMLYWLHCPAVFVVLVFFVVLGQCHLLADILPRFFYSAQPFLVTGTVGFLPTRHNS